MKPQIVTIVEVGPRDGLQNELRTLNTAEKVQLIDALVAAIERHLARWTALLHLLQVLVGLRHGVGHGRCL